jgi:hypothetical protein
MSQQSARAKWQASNGDAEASKPDAHGTVRPPASLAYGSDSQKKAYGAMASTPSMGGENKAGKDSANCDDALGNPGKHHGGHVQATVTSGRGPAANDEQHTTQRRTGINSKTKDDFAKDSAVEDINPKPRSVPVKRA